MQQAASPAALMAALKHMRSGCMRRASIRSKRRTACAWKRLWRLSMLIMRVYSRQPLMWYCGLCSNHTNVASARSGCRSFASCVSTLHCRVHTSINHMLRSNSELILSYKASLPTGCE